MRFLFLVMLVAAYALFMWASWEVHDTLSIRLFLLGTCTLLVAIIGAGIFSDWMRL